MDKLLKKRIGAIAAVTAVVAWIGVPIMAQRIYSVPAVEVAFGITVLYWLVLQVYRRTDLLKTR